MFCFLEGLGANLKRSHLSFFGIILSLLGLAVLGASPAAAWQKNIKGAIKVAGTQMRYSFQATKDHLLRIRRHRSQGGGRLSPDRQERFGWYDDTHEFPSVPAGFGALYDRRC